MKRFLLAAVLSVVCLFPARALDLGDKAPAISPLTWVTGSPADPANADGTVYLVEVWSVTCPPCVRSIPIMNDIQKRYAERNFKIVSFTTDTEEEVKTFLDQHPMEYSSFIDKEGASYINYMAADNRTTIPHAFLFDKEGYLVWIGNPLDNLEERVKQVLDGTLNRERAVAIRDALRDFQDAFNAQDLPDAISNLKKLQKLEPDNIQYYGMHYSILSELGYGAPEDVRQVLVDWYNGAGDQADNMAILSLVARTQSNPTLRFPELSLAAAKKAYAMESPFKIQSGRNLAETYASIGRLDLARKTLDELMRLPSEDPSEDELIEALNGYFTKLEALAKDPDAEFKP